MKLQGQPKVMWLTESEDHGSVQFVQGITGAREIAGFGQKAVLKQMGQPNIYKNSIVGEILIRSTSHLAPSSPARAAQHPHEPSTSSGKTKLGVG